MKPADPTLLHATDIAKYFAVGGHGLVRHRGAQLRAVDGVSLAVRTGETFGIVGESGCGKSTLGRCLLRLYPLTTGRLVFDGRDISNLSQQQMRPLRREMQMIFQDPFASLNPRKVVEEIITDPLRAHGVFDSRRDSRRAQELLELVGLSAEHLRRYPHEFSGGQRQRISVARALALNPRLLVADEPVSALDVSIQAQVVNLLHDLQEEFQLTYIFIAHDLAVVRHVADRIAVMYLGQVVEQGDAEALCAGPRHPYTEALLSAVPIPEVKATRERKRIVLRGDVPSPIAPPSGCRFHTRCLYATDRCNHEAPQLRAQPDGRLVACHYPVKSAA